jgi:tuberous sclerosis protein 2
MQVLLTQIHVVFSQGQFLYACVVVQPLDHKTNRVTVKARPDLAEHIGHMDAKVVSDQNLPIMARQLALHANVSLHLHPTS